MAKQQPINLNQLSSYHQQAQTAQYLKQLGNTTIRTQELTGMAQLVAHFPAELPAWQAVYVDYAVPPISKEFDMLFINAEGHIINIELKSDVHYDIEKIHKQLRNNRYYLTQASPHVALFTYNSDLDRIYHLTDQNTLDVIDLQDECWQTSVFYQAVMVFKSVAVADLDNVLRVGDYLVSPFTQLARFLKEQYLLMQPQQQLQAELLATPTPGIYAVKAATSVGQTLMIYDTVKILREQGRVLLVHIGALKSTQATLRRQYGWHILPERQFFKKVKRQRLQPYDVVIVTDAQKLSIRHVNSLRRYFAARHTRVFLIGDPNQQSKATISNRDYFATLTHAFGQQHLIKLSDEL
ncbi:AAA family ATPase [Leuconostoc lactis]|uniref:AAA family ATPase n=1 Tax=Leuconostoc lactis TaxID=1246 RepID=UPI00101EF77B|nr:AAA family ATPase [Leuconostoc lactis]MSB66438.1 aspartate aminotransferase [Leuconostoc lactis]RYS87663.1 aspartate aminotransferase [Leuconostoc lactis]